MMQNNFTVDIFDTNPERLQSVTDNTEIYMLIKNANYTYNSTTMPAISNIHVLLLFYWC